MALVLSFAALALSAIAVAINASFLPRRPKIVARWGEVTGHSESGPPRGVLSIIVTARRRPIEVDEIGLVALRRKGSGPRRRRFAEWLHEDQPFRLPLEPRPRSIVLPKRLQDGESLRAFIDLEDAQEQLPRDYAAVSYVRASGTVYLAREDSKLQEWLTPTFEH